MAYGRINLAITSERCRHPVSKFVGKFLNWFIMTIAIHRLLARSINLMNTLEDETGLNPGFINNGGLFIAHNEV